MPITSATHTSSLALHAQLSRCQQQLADWMACPSGKTPEGQRTIASLNTQACELKHALTSTQTSTADPGAVGMQVDTWA